MSDLTMVVSSPMSSIIQATLVVVGDPHIANATSDQPNWIVALVLGAVVGTVVDKYGGVLLYPFRFMRSDHYLGEWWEYHLSYLHGQRTLRQAKLTVGRGVRTRVRHAKFWHIATDEAGCERKELKYKGTLSVENGQLLVELDATTHKEHLVYRFLNRIPSNDAVIPGIWMSFDHDSYPAAGAAVLSKQKMTVADAEAEILKHTTAGTIRIK